MEPATKKLVGFIIFLVIVIAGTIAFTIYNPFNWSWVQDIKKCDPCVVLPGLPCPEPIICPEPPKCENNIYGASEFIRQARQDGVVCKIITKNVDNVYPDSDNVKIMKIMIKPNVLGLMSNSNFIIEYYDCTNTRIFSQWEEFRTTDVIVDGNLIKFTGYSMWDSSLLTNTIVVEMQGAMVQGLMTTLRVITSPLPSNGSNTTFDYELEVLDTTVEEAVSRSC